MRRFNATLFFALVIGSAAAVALLFAVHWLQTGRIARALLAQADRAEEQGDLEGTARFLGRYLELSGDDIEARARLGLALSHEKVAVTPRVRTRALFVLEQVLARQPERSELRLPLVRIALELHRRDLAAEHLAILKRTHPQDGEAAYLAGLLHEAEKDWGKAEASYRDATRFAPRKVQAYVRLADLLRRRTGEGKPEDRQSQADQVMIALVEQNPDSHQAHLARWRYLQQWGKLGEGDNLEKAAVHVRHALKLAPDHADVLLAAGELAQAEKDLDQARSFFQRGRQLYPRDVRFCRELAWLELRAKNRHQAVVALREGVQSLRGEARVELLWMLGNVLIDGGDTSEAQAVIAEMARVSASPASIDYLQARLHVLAGRWADAARLLERSRELLATSAEVARQTDLLLAQCYDRLHHPEARLAAYSRLTSREPSSLTAQLGKAASLVALGDLDQAFVQYQQAARLPNAPPSIWLELARISLLRNLRSPAPDWEQFDRLVEQAAWHKTDGLELTILRAESLAAQAGQPRLTPAQREAKRKQAEELLQQARKDHPGKVEVWAALAALADQDNRPDDALKFLQEAQQELGDSAALHSTLIQFWLRRGGNDAKTALVRLAEGIDRFAADEQGRLLADLGEACWQLGEYSQAEAYWERLTRRPEYRDDLRHRLRWFNAALKTGNQQAMQRIISEIQRIEGAAGVWGRYCTAIRLIRQSRESRDARHLTEARNLLESIGRERPSWPAILVARAEIDDLSGNPDQAIAGYRRAIELGDRNPRVFRLLVEVLYRQQRYDEAEQEIRRLQQIAPSDDLKRLIVDIAFRRQDYDTAASQVLDAVSPDSTDGTDHLWLGQVLAASNRHADQAEQHLRKAVELAGDRPETWIALVQFYAASGKTTQALAALAQVPAKVRPEDAFLATAVCHEILNQPDKAQQAYQMAVQTRPSDIRVLRSAAAFALRRGQLAQAEPLLRQIIANKAGASPADRGWARRSLALALAGTGNWQRFQESLALLGLKYEQGRVAEMAGHVSDDPADEQRVRIRVLARQPGKAFRQKAIALLEELSRRQKLPGDEQFLLAQLYEAEFGWPKARDLLRDLTVKSKNPIHLVYHAQGLLRNKELADADRVLALLEQLEKERKVEAGTFGSVEFRAQQAELQGRPDRAIAMLRDYAGRPKADPDRMILVIHALGRQKRFDEALQLCEQLRTKCPPEQVAAVSVALLRASRATEPKSAGVAAWLAEQVEKKPDSPFLLLQLADLKDLAGRYAEVEKIYRQVLKIDERNVIALNNLAWHLAQHQPGQAGEALKFINRAIELAGPQPDLLDTRASVYLVQQRPDLAIADLELANADRPVPVRWFHLAQAHRRANNRQAARNSLQRATAAGLNADQLHPVERGEFQRLQSELEPR